MGRGHALDANTLALYRFDENYLEAKDSSSHGYDLLPTNSAGQCVASLVRDRGKSKFFDGTFGLSGGGGNSWAAFFAGEHTVELWSRLGDTGSTSRRFFEFYSPGGTAVSNRFYFGLKSDPWKLMVGWDHGTRVTVEDNSFPLGFNPVLYARHYAYRKRQSGGSWVIDYFVNGTLIDSSGELPDNYSGGSLCTLYVGGAVTEAFFGRIDDVRFSTIARTEAEIQASYTRGVLEPVLIIES
jgi:hypothetical protein